MRKDSSVRTRLTRATALGAGSLAVAFGLLGAGTAQAANFEVGEVTINTQVSISAGFGIRTEGRDGRLICPANLPGVGTSTTCNGDNGNLNFDSGDFVNAPVRVQGEVEASWQNFTVYARGQAFYDYIYDNGDLAFMGGAANYRDLAGRQTEAGQNTASHGYEIMDLWVRGKFDIGDNQLIAKIGQQSISWGEALFTPLSFAQVNSFDISKLRQPGAELRDAVRSMPAALLTYEVGSGLSVEAFYQFEFRPTIADASGSFFSTSDIVGQGGTGFGAGQDYDVIFPNVGGFSSPVYVQDDENNDGKNYGVAMRYFSPELNNTEFGLYYANITARLPVPTFVTPAVLTASPFVNANNGRLEVTYLEDVKMLGTSFNTSIDALGVSLAGEVAWMHDYPLLIDGESFATAYICALIPAPGAPCSAVGFPNQVSTQNGLTAGMPGQRIEGFVRDDIYTFMLRGIKTLGGSDFPTSAIGANSISLIAEFGGVYADLPNEKILAFDVFGNGTPGSGAFTDPLTGKYEAATDFSVGVTAVASASYPDAFAGVNLTPSLRYATGLYGNSPVAAGYIERASALSFQLDADYLLAWRGSIGYTTYFGGRQNPLNDRDFFSASISYTF
ncbi:DUF1302 family protein [Oleomonas cavernae]|uniref:DUF1302 family protein n=1 Tax=Oleomonas cavernae TaxID=2320859 RepID=A0A418WHU9_9PROT|nr:DUF1302 family protein [Oleomonas cavernae]RJF89611.1 DUF1302 family protein [Oleomonas cavernae]